MVCRVTGSRVRPGFSRANLSQANTPSYICLGTLSVARPAAGANHESHSPPLHAGLNKYSKTITQPKKQGASQAMLYATGLNEEDMNKPQVGIASCWYEGNPCNMHLLDLAAAVKEGVQEAGLIGYRFNTIGVSDGMSMGTDGMSFSLQSRDLIADSIETVMSAQVRSSSWTSTCALPPFNVQSPHLPDV